MSARAVVDIDYPSPHAGGVERMLEQLNSAISPVGLARFLEVKVQPYVQARARARFASEGDDVSGKWAPLEPATQNIRAQLGYGPTGPINRRTGQLEQYITQTPGLLTYDGMGASIIMPGVEATGELKKKMETAQKGRKKRPITPARPVIGLNEQDLIWTLAALGFHITEGIMP